MKKKLCIMIACLVLSGIIVTNVSMSVHGDFSESTLMLENIEALASPESGEDYGPCVIAKGFCIVNKIQINGIAIID